MLGPANLYITSLFLSRENMLFKSTYQYLGFFGERSTHPTKQHNCFLHKQNNNKEMEQIIKSLQIPSSIEESPTP